MRTVVVAALLVAVAWANPVRHRRDESVPEPADLPLLDIPDPGPFEDKDLIEPSDGPKPTVVETHEKEPVSKLDDHIEATLAAIILPEPTVAPLPASSDSKDAQEPAKEESAADSKAQQDSTTGTTASKAAVPEDSHKEPTSVAHSPFEQQEEQPNIEVCDETNAPGRSRIYCSGRLLDAVNIHHLFKDSKTFVDRPMKTNRTEDAIIADFELKFPMPNPEIDPTQLRAFVEQHFEQEGHELDECEVIDWNQSPPAFAAITDNGMHEFAIALNDIWKQLCRHIKTQVRDEPERFSLIHVPNNFIAPGGRFREFYYWDTYWILKGLLASGMYETTRGMIENLASIIDRYGFIPNGGRIYYLKRSQPPFFAAMVYDYYEATRNKTFLHEMLPLVEREFNFWQNERSIIVEANGANHTMFQYRTAANVPRPESYREDTTGAKIFPSIGRQQQFYRDLGSAAESGWDFSTRWFADKKTILSIDTTNIVPVDLNAMICYNMNLMSFFHAQLGNENKEISWHDDYIKFRDAFKDVFYVESQKGWFDYNLRNRTHNTDFYSSMAVPLFAGCYEQLSLTEADDLYDHMADMGVFDFAGGVPTTMAKGTQEQWDFPNGWSPLNHMIIEGLRKTNSPRLQQKAFQLASKWVRANYHVWKVDKAMWEKYNVATNEPRTGGGGEYEVQAGFGWTNGVVLDLLISYGDRLNDNDGDQNPAAPMSVPSATISNRTADALKSTTSSAETPALILTLLATVVARLFN